MREMRKILCPTDFSDFSDRALDYALVFAKWYAAEVTVLHVVPQLLMHPEYFPYMQEPIPQPPDVQERAFRELGTFIHRARAAGVSTEVSLEQGDAVDEIVAMAKKLPADLIVMGTHGRRGFEKLVLGSVAEKVLRKAPCPVLTVGRSAAGAPERPVFKKILCPVDFSDSSSRALDFAISLAREADAEIIALNVVEFLFAPESSDRENAIISQHYAQLRQDAQERLRELVPGEDREWLRIEEKVVAGRAHREILRIAGEESADLIVMGVHGRGGIDLAVFGSTTQQVVREASCPVLTIRFE